MHESLQFEYFKYWKARTAANSFGYEQTEWWKIPYSFTVTAHLFSPLSIFLLSFTCFLQAFSISKDLSGSCTLSVTSGYQITEEYLRTVSLDCPMLNGLIYFRGQWSNEYCAAMTGWSNSKASQYCKRSSTSVLTHSISPHTKQTQLNDVKKI